ncbi:VWA domain-containing protein [Humisphaera borealis]|uniref:VWA domain-containing protein n=2 Tax=Humisphaera borealis TaxID=2807512 RepID=A0A7M2X0D3_9BACT|nr:VWA domain-containing protein [Humisphaera borealis]
MPARGDGFIVIHNPPARPVTPGHFTFAPLEVTYHRVNVEISDSVATTTVEQEFYNPNPQRLEGTYLFPLPDGTHIDKFSMDVNGKMMEAELLDAGKARQIYEDIVRQARDPALLEYAGRSAFKVRIFPIEPHSRKPVKITYTQLLKTDTGLTEYVYPLNTEKFSSKPLSQVSVKVSLKCSEPIKSLYCPSHDVEIKRDGDKAAVVGWERANVRPDTDFKVIYSRTDKPVSVDLLTYRNGPDDGYFLLLAAPGMTAPKGEIQKKDVCFVLDTSGSMSENNGKKMEQAKKALSFCLQNLNEGDRFEIVRFSTEAEPLFNELRAADKANLETAQKFVASLRPIGGTAINDALTKAMELKSKRGGDDKERPYVVIFLTDGQPTIGETNEDNILAAMNKAQEKGGAAGSTRVFSFGIGTDVNTHLLDRIASGTRAFSQYVLPDENLEVKLSNFYTKIKEPVLANVEVTFTGGDIKTTQLYPNALPDLFKGEQVILFGRYSGKGAAAVKISGTLNGQKQTFVQDVTFAEKETKNAFIPALWATRRIGFLLDEIRLRGESRELRDEVTRLAREHGIVTPYTAFLILEDESRRNVPLAMQTLRELRADAPAASSAAGRYESARDEFSDRRSRAGEKAVANAKDVDALKQQWNLEQGQRGGEELRKRPAGAPGPVATTPGGRQPQEPGQAAAAGSGGTGNEYGYRQAQNYTQQARVVNGRAFYQNGKTWTDATAQEAVAKNKALRQQEVKFNTDAYFALLKEYPESAQWLSLGEEVDVVLGDTLYQIRG